MDTNVTLETLQSMTYNELRALAKSMGLKLRVRKMEKIIKEILLNKDSLKKSTETPVEPPTEVNRSSSSSLKKVMISPKRKKRTRQTTSALESDVIVEERSLVITPTNEVVTESSQMTRSKRHVRKNTFEKENEMGCLTPEITDASPRGPESKRGRIDICESPTYQPVKEITGESFTTAPKGTTIAINPRSNIPRLVEVAKTKTQKARAATPNFKKLHEKQFSQMASLDEYVQKKAERSALLASGKKLQVRKLTVTPHVGRKFQPTVLTVKEANFNFAEINTPSLQPLKKESGHMSVVRAQPSAVQSQRVSHAILHKKNNATVQPVKREAQRHELKGVRTNRRFQLQMQFRARQ